ncbi:MAG: type 4a pilus biogenesis protein PilO [Deltaproteobacteria bacterium]
MAISMDSILKLSTSKKILILAAILCVITGVYYTSVFSPQQQELNAMKKELSKLVEEVEKSKAISRDLEKYKAQVEQMNKELAVALTQLPTEKEIPEILKNISSLGKESQLEFTLFRPKPEEPQPYYAKVPIELSIVGSYHNTGAFFDKVSKQPRIINVVDFNMTKLNVKGRDEATVRVSCLLNTYRYVEKKSDEKKGEGKKSEKKTAE